MIRRTSRRTAALVIFGMLALAACVPVAPKPPPPTTAAPAPPNPCASAPAQSAATGVDYVAVTKRGSQLDVHKFHADSTADRDEQVAQLAQAAEVVSVAPDQTVHAADINDPLALPPASPPAPGDPNPIQWGVYASHFPDAWTLGNQGQGVRIAIVDSGVQADHEDLAGQVVAGKDFVTPGVTDGLSDFYGHGTHVAGIAAALVNGVGGVGGAPQAKLVSARVLNCSGAGSLFNVEQGVLWATTPVAQGGGGAQVVNLSLGTSTDDPTLDSVIAGVEAQGVVVVAAAGNCGMGGPACENVADEPLFPAAASTVHHADPANDADVIAVASIDSSESRSLFSNSNSYVDLAAPGGQIISTCPVSLPASKCTPSGLAGYSFKSGTSMATPFVSAAAALLAAACPSSTRNLSWTQFVQSRLEGSAELLQGASGPTDDYGWGLVRPDQAIDPGTLVCPA
jgi:subtilisin family serine protease